MTEPPPRRKAIDDWSVEDHLRHQQTGEVPESDGYRDAVREAIEAAGLELPDVEPALEDMTVEDHVRRIRRRHDTR